MQYLKWIKYSLLAIFIIGVFYIIIVFTLILKGTKEAPTNEPDSILVLGAQVKGKTADDAYPSSVLRERLDAALSYAKAHTNATIIVCGGKGSDEPVSEAEVMANYLIENGIDKNRIILENTSTNTKENIIYAQRKMMLDNTVIVTSDFHMYRSLLIAKRSGITNASGLPALSTSSAKLKTYIREVASLSYSLLFG